MAQRKPDWLKVRIPSGAEFAGVSKAIKSRGLHTVCEEARCPNKAECWECGTATFMILGDVCTRNCRFCAVKTGREGVEVDHGEPERLAEAVRELELEYVVLTSVDRDDLPDRGSKHFAECVKAVKKAKPKVKVEVLIPDYSESELKTVIGAGPDVVAHNIEVVKRLQSKVRDARAGYVKSLRTLKEAKKQDNRTKSSIMLGLGETEDEVLEAMDDLRDVGCDILVIGQYLQPTLKQIPVVEYIHPDQFKEYRTRALKKGFREVVSSPLARTSYRAKEAFA
ncbi:MAG: lipoyl synthase [Candidatus Altiarchaeota archaeon]|nr:lipoyl synthase [Candidatus Altiarchaeota archaeon]